MDRNEKVFLTYNQQMKYLRDNKFIACRGTNDKTILCRKGYFNLINGYKTPFTCGKDADGHYKYYNNTSIAHFYALKEFDDELRFLLFKYLSKVEEEIRTFAAYKFDEMNMKPKAAWYEVSAYNPSCDVSRIIELISKAYSEISRSRQDYVKHHVDNHKLIPTWVLVKFISFATFIDFIDYGKVEIKRSLCELYSIKNTRGVNDYKLLLSSLNWMRNVRNMCAHNERVYDCIRKNGRIIEAYFNEMPNSYKQQHDQRVFDLLVYMKYYLASDEYEIMIQEIKRLLLKLSGKLQGNAFNNVRANLGIKDINHLDKLLENKKSIAYHKF